jgi:hypothetical protein
MADGLEREAALEHPMYQEALETVNVLKARRTELQEMVEKTKADISEMDAEQLAVPTALFDGDVTATPRPSLEPASLRNFREGRTFPTNDVDGSVLGDLPDNYQLEQIDGEQNDDGGEELNSDDDDHANAGDEAES